MTTSKKPKAKTPAPSVKKAKTPAPSQKIIPKAAPAKKEPRRKLKPEETKLVEKVSPALQSAAIESLTYTPHEFKQPNYVPATKDTDELAVFVNEHRNTCIRISIGSRKVTFIPLDSEGIMVRRCGIDTFNAEWRLTLANHSPIDAAHQYLNSYAAMRHISEEARTLLGGIISKGANQNHIIVKENQMNTNTSTSTTKGGKKLTPPAISKPAAKLAAKEVKPAAKATGKAAVKPAAKATGKAAVKPAAKGKPAAAKPAASRAGTYAGHKIKVLNKDHGAREGTKRQIGMDILISSKTTDEALTKFAKHDGIDTSFIRFAIDNGIIELN